MRVLVVTSEVTFVPNNYNDLVCGLAKNPYVVGLVILKNKTRGLMAQATAISALNIMPRLGLELLKNIFGTSDSKRRAAYRAENKKVYYLKTMNTPEALDLVDNEDIDVIFNVRTRCIYRKAILSKAKIGCLNIHHGLLPDQRGLMCDLWAHYLGEDCGFSVHQMTSNLDAGDILRVTKVPKRKDLNFLEYTRDASRAELKTAEEVFEQIAQTKEIKGIPNTQTQKTVYRSNPKVTDAVKMRLSGVRV